MASFAMMLENLAKVFGSPFALPYVRSKQCIVQQHHVRLEVLEIINVGTTNRKSRFYLKSTTLFRIYFIGIFTLPTTHKSCSVFGSNLLEGSLIQNNIVDKIEPKPFFLSIYDKYITIEKKKKNIFLVHFSMLEPSIFRQQVGEHVLKNIANL